MRELTSFAQDSRILIDASSLIAAAASSDVLNHFLDDLLDMKSAANATITIAQSTIAQLDELSRSNDEKTSKAAKRVMGSLLNCIKAEEIHLVTTPKGQSAQDYLKKRSVELPNERVAYIIVNDLALAGEIYQVAKTSTSTDDSNLNILEAVEDDGRCKLAYVDPHIVLPTQEPEGNTEPTPPTPYPDGAKQYDEEELEHELRRRKIESLIQLAGDDELPEIVRDAQGHIKVPHK